jgi:X-Pro dipeptidyl-peptidase (S15 family)
VRKLVALLTGLALAAPAAQAAPPDPFGHACTAENGVRICRTASDAQRVPSWDGVPLDVDVTLPPTGDGPFPAIVMLHGWGGNKLNFESTTPEGNGGSGYHYNNVFYAQQGYAVINPSSRGDGRSCGRPDSRTAPACDRGWVRLADQRYEGRDVQHLLALLADQGVIRPRAIGVTGVSYGGIQSLNLARLRDRVRRPNGSYRRWRSPDGKRMRIAAAFARWGASDLAYSLQPNGRFLDFRDYVRGQSIRPGGVAKKSYNDALYGAGAAAGFYAPLGSPFNADITGWKALTDRGEPARPDALAVGRELTRYHSMAGVSGVPAPLLVQNGWTDDLFPAPEALRVWNLFRDARGARVTLQLGDFGHPRGGNNPVADRDFNDDGAAFFAAHLTGEGRAPRHGAVKAYTQVCPTAGAPGALYRARSWERLHPDRVLFGAPRPQTVTSNGGNPETARAIDPIGAGGACRTVPAEETPGTAVSASVLERPVTLLGSPTVRARLRTDGRGGFLAARLWDVSAGRQTLVARGVYRLEDDQRGPVVFQLFGNGWRFGSGHTVKLELTGDDPNFLRTSNFEFSVRVSKLRVSLPTP